MPRYFTHYWTNETYGDYRSRGAEGERWEGVFSSEFERMGVREGDFLYSITVLAGELYLLARFEVDDVQPYTGDENDEPGQRWNTVAYARTATPLRFDNKVPLSIVESLEFISEAGKLKFEAPGKLDRQTLRGVRQLTPTSASVLDRQIDEYEAAEQTPTNVWMFQYIQEDYDLEYQVENVSVFDDWKVTAHRQHMRIGERVYFRRTVGKESAGITAVGRVVSEVYETNQPERPFQVDVIYEMRVEPPLSRSEAQQDDVLREYWALEHGQSGTTFLLPQAVASRVEDIVRTRLHPFRSQKLGVEIDSEHDARRRILQAVVQRQGQPEFRQRLLDAYGQRCAITGCDAVPALEAAHILPYRGQHTNDVTNGLLLRADLHTLFDSYFLAIDPSTMTVVLAPSLKASTYADLNNAPLRLPAAPELQPSRQALEQHIRLAGLKSSKA